MKLNMNYLQKWMYPTLLIDFIRNKVDSLKLKHKMTLQTLKREDISMKENRNIANTHPFMHVDFVVLEKFREKMQPTVFWTFSQSLICLKCKELNWNNSTKKGQVHQCICPLMRKEKRNHFISTKLEVSMFPIFHLRKCTIYIQS